MIDPSYQFLYLFQTKDTAEDIDIVFSLPSTFNPAAIKIDLNKELNAIKVTVENLIPIVCGKLYAKVESCITTTDNSSGEFTISLEKKTPDNWPILISEYYPGTEDIDPNSAFLLFQNLIEPAQKDQKIHDLAQKLINKSIDAGYIPALFAGIEISSNKGNTDETTELLKVAALKYRNPSALFLLGQLLSSNKNTVIEGFNILQDAAHMGVGMAVSLMGNILSPLIDNGFPAKEPSQALELYEEVIKHAEEPNALYEAARLYDAGLGCERNHEKALEYFNRAKKVMPSIPDLPTPPAQHSNTFKIGVVAGVVAVSASFAFLAYRVMRKKH